MVKRKSGGKKGAAGHARAVYYRSVKKSTIVVWKTPINGTKAVGGIMPGALVPVLEVHTPQGGKGRWVKVALRKTVKKQAGFGWVRAKKPNAGVLLAGPQEPEVRVVSSLAPAPFQKACTMMKREKFNAQAADLLAGKVAGVTTVCRIAVLPDSAPIGLILGARVQNVVEILYAVTYEHDRGKGLLRLLLAHMLKECCTKEDDIIVLSLPNAFAVWVALGFRITERDPKWVCPIGITNKEVRVFEWPKDKAFPSPAKASSSLAGFRRAPAAE